MVTSKAICETSCHKKFLVFYCAHICYLCRLSVILFDKILIMAGTQTRRAQQQILDFLSEETENLVMLPKGSFKKYVHRGGEERGVIEKRIKANRGRGVLGCV